MRVGRTRAALVGGVAALTTFAVSASAGAETSYERAAGHGAQGDVKFEVGASRAFAEVEATGAVTLKRTFGAGDEEDVLHGDVREGCLRVLGNRATVIGRVPPNEARVASDGTIQEFVVLRLEDNGNPIGGDPVDHAVALFTNAAIAEALCAVPPSPVARPLTVGNFVISDAPAS